MNIRLNRGYIIKLSTKNKTDVLAACCIAVALPGYYKIKYLLESIHEIKDIKLGFLDITFFRDDFGRENKVLNANKTSIDFIIENKTVVLIDDVLYTGRSVTAALSALQSFGRPARVELLSLIDRRFSRHLPIQPDYCGCQVDAINNQRVTVKWKEIDGEDSVYLYIKNGK